MLLDLRGNCPGFQEKDRYETDDHQHQQEEDPVSEEHENNRITGKNRITGRSFIHGVSPFAIPFEKNVKLIIALIIIALKNL